MKLLQTFCNFCDILSALKGGEEGMTQKEYELMIEIEKLKKENKKLKIKNKDLETEKKTFKNKLNIQNEQLEYLQKENKTIYYKNKYEIEKEKNKKLERELKDKVDYIANVLGQLHKNSSNSSKPSSTDGFKKVIHNNKKKTNKKAGAQEGHKYNAPKLVKEPTKTVRLKKVRKCECGGKIKYNGRLIVRQLIDLLSKYEVTEYQGEIGICEKCGKIHNPKFPKGINNKIQYGENTKGLALILTERGNVSVEKTKEIIGVLTNTEGPSEGSIMYWKENAYTTMKETMEDIKEEILKEPVVNSDETPLTVNGKYNYAIGSFGKNASAIECHTSRGKISFDKMNIFSRYGGILVGDHYAVNEGFEGQVAYCNAHTIRTAKGILDIRKDSKAKEYIEFMYKLKEEVEASPNNKLSSKRYKEVKDKYTNLLEEWQKEFNNFMKSKKPEYYREERNLIKLLLEYIDGHLLFAKESEVPFTNNDAERGLRPIKTKLKVIGEFKETKNANGYCNAVSIIQTCFKQKINPCQALGKIANGNSKVFAFQNI